MSQPTEPGQAAKADNVKRMNVLAQLAQEKLEHAARVREQARLIEAHARDLLGRLNQASAVNYSEPAKALAMLIKAERQFHDATAGYSTARSSKPAKQPKSE